MGIAGTKGLDFSVRQGSFVNVLRRTHRGFAGHDLPDKLLFSFHKLIEITVKGVLGDIGVDVYLVIFVALPDNAALPLLKV